MTIVCAVDASPRALRVADVTRRLADGLGTGVAIVHVFDPMMVPEPPARELDRDAASDHIEDHERRLAREALAAAAGALTGVPHTSDLAEGDPREELLRRLREDDVPLVVVGSAARRPLERIMRGSLSADLAAEAPCPVVVVPDDAELPDAGPVLAGYDGSEHSLRAARHAAGLAAVLGRELVLVHVVAAGEEGVGADRALADELHAAARSCVSAVAGERASSLDVTVAVEHGDPAERLVRAARERGACLVAVGHRGRNAVAAAVLGSVSGGVIRLTDRPVVVAGPRSDQARSPA